MYKAMDINAFLASRRAEDNYEIISYHNRTKLKLILDNIKMQTVSDKNVGTESNLSPCFQPRTGTLSSTYILAKNVRLFSGQAL